MLTGRNRKQPKQSQVDRQPLLLGHGLPSSLETLVRSGPCKIVAVERRRAGGMRYWCLAHHADATAKGGIEAFKCRESNGIPILADEMLELNLDKCGGGAALWGAVPPVYDTTRRPMDRGVHVHAREHSDHPKILDSTFRAVRLMGKDFPSQGVVVTEADAIYYMISSVFGFEMSYVTCTHCGWPHLDKDWFSVHPHRRHLCAGCGKHFRDSFTGIGNPIEGIRDYCRAPKHNIVPAKETLKIRQSDYPGGIQLWGSNAAFIWTQPKPEEEGIHVHAFSNAEAEPEIDGTFHAVTIDNIELNPTMVRFLMAQSAMPSLRDRVLTLHCPECGHPGFDSDSAAYTPSAIHKCSECGIAFPTVGRTRNVVANPLPAVLTDLATRAPRVPQRHQLDLLPETLQPLASALKRKSSTLRPKLKPHLRANGTSGR